MLDLPNPALINKLNHLGLYKLSFFRRSLGKFSTRNFLRLVQYVIYKSPCSTTKQEKGKEKYYFMLGITNQFISD